MRIKEKLMKKIVSLMLAVVMMLLTMTACGSSQEAGEAVGKEVSGDNKKILIVLPNVRGDGGTHDLACKAAEQVAEEIGAKLDIVELGSGVADAAKWEAALSDLCESNYDLIITGGSLMKDTIQTVAPMYPEVPFICYDVSLDFDQVDMPNVYGMDFYQNEAAYLAGVMAALTTESNYIGFLGATKIPVIYDFMVGYISGAQAVKPDIKVAVAFTNDFNDATTAKELALAQISDGVDVLFPACGISAAGLFEAARDKGVTAIGNDQDMAAKYAQTDESILEIILASVMKKVDNAVLDAYERFEAGTLPLGSQETVGVAIDGVGVVKNTYYEEKVPAEVQEAVAAYEQQITDGSVQVPTAIGMSSEEIEVIMNSAQ